MHQSTVEDEEFRFKGNNMGIGKILKGTVNEAPIKLKVSSIPSKTQNIIYRSRSERAFGDSTKKFYHPMAPKQSGSPGPGVYNCEPMFKKIASKKGSGSFASSTVNNRLHRSRSYVPGPGSYQISNNISKQNLNQRTPRKANSNSSILNTTTQSSSNLANLSTKIQSKAHDLFKHEIQYSKKFPGVGCYELSTQIEKMNRTLSLKSTFKSKVERFPQSKVKNPPVGLYDPERKSENSPDKKIKKMKNDEDPEKIPKNDKARKEKLEKIISNIEQRKTSLHKDHLGPGTYHTSTMFGTKNMGFTIKESMYDRFGNLKPVYAMAKEINFEENAEKYGMNQTEGQKKSSKGPTSMFKSSTGRPEVLLNGKMDPCLYKTDRSSFEKKSHLINFVQKWV